VGIISSRELARTFENEVGGQPRAMRRWAVSLSDDTLDGNPPTEIEIATHLGILSWGLVHPTMNYRLRKVTVNERFGDSPYLVEVIAEYGDVTDNEILAPTSRTHEWSFESARQEVPALFYFDDTGTKQPLTNSAYDYFEGLTTEETMVKAIVKMNLPNFPTAQIQSINTLNNASWFGGPTYSWKVNAVNPTWVEESFNGNTYQYWATTCELMYRQTGWVMQLPDVGWNYLAGGQKHRAMVFDEQNAEWVASANPVGLNGSGQQKLGAPAILPRRLNGESNFTALFGTPPE